MTCNQNCRQGRDCNCAGWHVVPLNDLRESCAIEQDADAMMPEDDDATE